MQVMAVGLLTLALVAPSLAAESVPAAMILDAIKGGLKCLSMSQDGFNDTTLGNSTI